jgi:hypothetical protein
LSDPEIVDDRPQTVRLDVDRAERDRQLECASILLEGIGVEGDAPCRTVRPPSLSGTAQSEDAKHTSGSSPPCGDLADDFLALLPSPTSCRSDEKPSKDGRELITQNNYAQTTPPRIYNAKDFVDRPSEQSKRCSGITFRLMS